MEHPRREDRREILNKIMNMVLDSQDIVNTPVEKLQSELESAIQKQIDEWGEPLECEIPPLEN